MISAGVIENRYNHSYPSEVSNKPGVVCDGSTVDFSGLVVVPSILPEDPLPIQM